MATEQEEVAHILFHVDAEAATTDPSQTPGVVGRAQRVRALLNPHGNSELVFNRKDFLSKLINTPAIAADLKMELDLVDPEDDGENLIMVLLEWVGKGGRNG